MPLVRMNPVNVGRPGPWLKEVTPSWPTNWTWGKKGANATCSWLAARSMVFAHGPNLLLNSADYVDNSLVKGDAFTARVTAIKIIGKYLALMVWPASTLLKV